MQNWFKHLMQQFGEWPTNYLSFDLETTGISVSKDLMLEFGFSLVIAGKEELRGEIIIDWTHPSGGVDQAWLAERLTRTYESMRDQGIYYPFSPSFLREHGRPPMEALAEIGQLLDDQYAEGYALVSHNGFRYDVPMLQSHFHDFRGEDWHAKASQHFDVGAMEKFRQQSRLAEPGDNLLTFMERASRAGSGKGVKWNLWNHCVPFYGIDARFGADHTQSHRAAYDAWVSHLLFETYREIGSRDLSVEDCLRQLVA